MKSALKPESYDIRRVWAEEDTQPKTGINVEDEELAALSSMGGWSRLKDHIQSLKDGLDKRLSQSVLESLGDAQVKTDAVFSVLGKELLNSIIGKVESSREIVEQLNYEREQREKNKRGGQ